MASIGETLARGRDDNTSDHAVERQVFTIVALTGLGGTAAWTAAYLAAGEPLAAAVPGLYFVITVVALPIALRTEEFGWFRDLQLTLMVVLPFVLMVVLGGFIAGSAVITWAITAPLTATLSTEPERARWWFAALALLMVSGLWLESVTSFSSDLPSALREALFVGNVLVPSSIVYLVVRKFVAQRDHARRLLRAEQQKSEDLLYNVLPQSVAERLKESDEPLAEHFENVTVLFADIVGFTPISAETAPSTVVEALNDIFSHFDTTAEHFGVEKLRTIGDNYFAACGVPVRRADHATAMADFALAIRDHEPVLPPGLPRLVFRIGISSGPVMAGVIGTSRYQFDVWGDTVNTAARMESHGLAGQIQVSSATASLLEPDFDLEPRGVVDIKGKGPMEVFLLHSRRN